MVKYFCDGCENEVNSLDLLSLLEFGELTDTAAQAINRGVYIRDFRKAKNLLVCVGCRKRVMDFVERLKAKEVAG